MMIHKVEDSEGNVLLENISLDERFKDELEALDESFEERRQKFLQPELTAGEPAEETKETKETNATEANEKPQSDENNTAEMTDAKKKINIAPNIFFKDPDQLIKPTTAYVTTTLLQGVIEDAHGTGRLARSIGRPVAGKTGTTNGYYDAWFVGYTADIATGVWVGYDNEATLGKGEVGGRSALPIWLEYMKFAHENQPIRNFTVPENIVFANIDNETGRLASSNSKEVVKQAFVEGTEPQEVSEDVSNDESDENFYKEDLAE